MATTNKNLIKSFIERLRIVMTGCGFDSRTDDDPGWLDCRENEFIAWNHDGKAFKVTVERCSDIDVDHNG